MTDHLTPAEARASIVPKSDQLNADDLLTGPITVTVTGAHRGDREQPIVVEIEGHRPWKPCKTCRRLLIAVWSDDPKKWVGQRITLYCDPSVLWAGVRVGGIRVSHMSGLDAPKTLLLTEKRGKRSEVTVLPLANMTQDEATAIEAGKRDIAAADTLDSLKAVGVALKKQSKTVQDELRPIYAARQTELMKPKPAANTELEMMIDGYRTCLEEAATVEQVAAVIRGAQQNPALAEHVRQIEAWGKQAEARLNGKQPTPGTP